MKMKMKISIVDDLILINVLDDVVVLRWGSGLGTKKFPPSRIGDGKCDPRPRPVATPICEPGSNCFEPKINRL
ncbi:hypothetical protein CsSME_00022261 [Camellia sinensis var. sinensis]